jgi:hypothetical protein
LVTHANVCFQQVVISVAVCSTDVAPVDGLAQPYTFVLLAAFPAALAAAVTKTTLPNVVPVSV